MPGVHRKGERGIPGTWNSRGCPGGDALQPQGRWLGGEGRGEGLAKLRVRGCRGNSTGESVFTVRSWDFVLWAVNRDGWGCPSDTSKVTQTSLHPSAPDPGKCMPFPRTPYFCPIKVPKSEAANLNYH